MRKRIFISFALLLALLGVGLAVRAWLFVDLPSLDSLDANLHAPSTRILDRNGRLLYQINDPHAGRHTPLQLDEIPLYCRQATVATEDATFYTNPGVEWAGIVRAVWINLRGGETLSGGSTITQQLARNLLLSSQERSQRTLTRKLRESILAWRLARAYSKDQILALYLNQVYYGNLAHGIEAAANTYFGKKAGELDLAECALLAGLPQSPPAYDPLINLPAAQGRQATVLKLMVKHGAISSEQAALARNERLGFAAVPHPIEAPHWVMYVRAWLEGQFGLEALYRDGLVVTTTLDLDWQNTAQAIARRHLENLSHGDEGQPRNVNNAALVALDPHTGQILAMLGSPDYFDAQTSGAVNATLALRQPGSAIKPVTYAAAFDPKRPAPYTPATMVLDVRTAFVTREGEPYVPRNYDSRYHGPVLLRQALASSYNIPAVKVLDQVGIERMIELARQMGIRTFGDSERYGLALTLGGGEVRLLDMAAAYAVLANGGYAVEPAAVLEVRDARGALRYRWRQAPAPSVLDERVAFLVSDILSDPQARAPAFGEWNVLRLSVPAAAKTGTTSDWRDNWTLGYTPELVAGVWVGNANNQPMLHVSGITGAGPIWHDFMEAVLKGQPARPFSPPQGLLRVEVCALSGLLPNPAAACPHTRTEWFIAGTQPTQYDTFYRRVKLDGATGQPATAATPAGRVVERVCLVLPGEAQAWAEENGILECRSQILDWGSASTPQPPTSDPQPAASNLKLVMTQPDHGTVYQLTALTPLDTQRIPVSARPADDVQVAGVSLLVDGQPLASFEGNAGVYRALWTLTPGVHTFSAQGLDPGGLALSSAPVTITVR
ncbi:MAG: PBP1A family penicillin-binding protein [Thermoflexales bacterium]|nr:PBP1A family penicillin-binding protein [Thermoflexales bacterium]